MSTNTKPWGHTPKLTKEDRERLAPVCANGNTIVQYMGSGDANVDDLKRIILMEYKYRSYPRKYIVDRCFSRLAKLQRYNAENVLETLKKSV